MCGIVGYIGPRDGQSFLLEGLRRLEYRGYDSAGLALRKPHNPIQIVKAVGRIDNLAQKLAQTNHDGVDARIASDNGHAGGYSSSASASPASTPTMALGRTIPWSGVGHTRWATHGPATEANAHPHWGGDSSVVAVHNGVIENYAAIKENLMAQGYVFHSATDSEVVAHLVDQSLEKTRQPQGARGDENPTEPAGGRPSLDSVVEAVKLALSQLRGTYGLVLMFRDFPELLIAARLGSPLVVGVGNGEYYVASDSSPLVGHTDKIVYLADHQLGVITPDSLDVTHRDEGRVRHDVVQLKVAADDVSLDGFPHFMLKEIYEQPTALQNAMRGRLSEQDGTSVFGGLNLTPQQLRSVDRVILTACGTSWHAGLYGEYVIEDLAGVPVEVEYASELRYRNAPVEPGTLLFAITQSGETADTLAALREMKRKGHPTLAICNVVGSSIAQETDGGVFLHAGPEIGVASTKAYTSQCLVLAMLALHLGRLRNLGFERGRRIIDALQRLPEALEKALSTNDAVRQVAGRYQDVSNFLYLGRQYNFPTALEGALKLKEISYIHAEGYPAAEMKHGPIALVDKNTPSVFIIPQGFVYEKVLANIEEIKARGGPVIAVATEGDRRIEDLADDTIYVPVVEEYLQPLVSIVPLQLLAYHIAVLRGCDVDKPRNLAKSVTVE